MDKDKKNENAAPAGNELQADKQQESKENDAQEDEQLKVDDETLKMILELDAFKMFANHLSGLADQMGVKKFKDCEQVIEPSSRDEVFILVAGGIAIVDDERANKRAKLEVRKIRRKRKKAQEKREQEGGGGEADGEGGAAGDNAAGQNNAGQDEENEHTQLVTDFPFEAISKADYKLVEELGTTFGNDKILTGKNYRPSFVMSISD